MNNKRVLIVKSNEKDSFALMRLLKDLGYHVCGIIDKGEDVMGVLLGMVEKPDVILLNPKLNSNIDGYQVARIISRHFRLPIVFLLEEGLQKERYYGADEIAPKHHILKKPVNKYDLNKVLNVIFKSFKREENPIVKGQNHSIQKPHSNKAAFQCDIYGYVSSMNTTAEELLRYSKEDVLQGVDIRSWFETSDLEKLGLTAKYLLDTAVLGVVNKCKIIRKDRSTFFAKLWFELIYSENEVVGLNGYILENSEEQRMELTKKLEEGVYRMALREEITDAFPRSYVLWNLKHLFDFDRLYVLDYSINKNVLSVGSVESPNHIKEVKVSACEYSFFKKLAHQILIERKGIKFSKKENILFHRGNKILTDGNIPKCLMAVPVFNSPGGSDQVFYMHSNVSEQAYSEGDLEHFQLISAQLEAVFESFRQEKREGDKYSWYKTLINATPEGIVVTDKSNQLLYANQSFCDLTGYELNEIKKKDFFQKLYTPGSYQKVKKEFSNIQPGNTGRFMVEIQPKTGARKKIQVSSTPIYDISNEYQGRIAVHMDVTDLMLKIEKSRYCEMEFALVQETSGVGSYQVNLGERTFIGSQPMEDLLGFKSNKKYKLALLLDRVHTDDRVRFQEHMQYSFKNETQTRFAHRIVSKSGEQFSVESMFSVINDEYGLPVRIIGTIKKITSEKD